MRRSARAFLTASLLSAVAFGCTLLLTHADTTLGPNLIANANLEAQGSNGLPTGWFKGGYGTNDRALSYPVTSTNGTKATQVKITTYTSGDAKWFFTDVPVTASSTYQFSDDSTSDVSTIVTVRYAMPGGTYVYKDIGSINSGTQHPTIQFAPPAGAISMTIFHLVKGVGTLTTDNYSLNEVLSSSPPPPPPPPPPPSVNLIPNGNLEAGTTDKPTGWDFDFWGTISGTYNYPIQGGDGSKAARITIQTYQNGDAKWYFNPITLPAGTYTYTEQYNSSSTTYVDVQLHNANGSYTYQTIATPPATTGWQNLSANFTVPAGTLDVTVYHLIESVGTLSIDNATITQKSAPTGVFLTGAVSLRFDDGEQSQFDNALPIMDAHGFKGTFYIISHQLLDYGFSGYMSINEVKQLASKGEEIGAHTRTHAHLTTLNTTDLSNEVQGSRQDLLAMSINPVLTFAYPYGEYNASVTQAVKNAGFTSAAATIDGYVAPASDPYQLEYREVINTTTLSQVKQWIDQAAAQKIWVILTFHTVANTCSDMYCTTPALFSQMMDYLAASKLPVITVSEGLQSLK